MSESLSLNGEEKNKNIGLIVSAIVHLLLTLICFINVFHYYNPPPPPITSIIVNFGSPDTEESNLDYSNSSSVDEASDPSQDSPSNLSDRNESSATTSNSSADVMSDSEEKEAIITAQSKPKTVNKSNSPTSEELALKKEQDRIAKAQAKKAEADAKEKEALSKSKQKFSDILGKGKGNTSAGDNNGNPQGDQDEDVLDNLSKGSGSIGSGLGNRSVVFEPTIIESSQKTGKVVVDICINAKGRVTKAKFTQSGSTTTDANLVRIAEKAAKKYVFTESTTVEQCGNVIIDFKVK